MSAIEIESIDKSFGATEVLRSVDLAVADGSTLSLLGPSGSGKSTLLRIIAGLERADRGVVRLDGADVTAIPPHRRGVGMVFQGQALFPHLDVGANVAYGLRRAGVGRAERLRRVTELLSTVGLAGYESRDPATLSGGEAQRVALARALAPRPGVLLLDEPLAALDQSLREQLLLELRAIFDELGVTVISVTHDPTEAGVLGDRLAVLLDGSVAQSGDAGDVLRSPASARVAGLVGHRNVTEGQIAGGRVTCRWGTFDVSASDGPASVLLRPDGLRVDASGSLEGVVVGRVFRGGSEHLVVEVAGSPLDVRGSADVGLGDPVSLAVEPDTVHVMG